MEGKLLTLNNIKKQMKRKYFCLTINVPEKGKAKGRWCGRGGNGEGKGQGERGEGRGSRGRTPCL